MTTPTPRTDAMERSVGNLQPFMIVVPADFASTLERELTAAIERAEELQKWKDAVLDECAICHLAPKADASPTDIVRMIGAWQAAVALDPAVSSDAAKLRDTYLERAEKAENTVNRISNDLQRTQDLLSQEIKLRLSAENRITELLTAWNHYA